MSSVRLVHTGSHLPYCTAVTVKIDFSTKARDWLWRTSPKWPILCRVGRKNLNSISQHWSIVFVRVSWLDLTAATHCYLAFPDKLYGRTADTTSSECSSSRNHWFIGYWPRETNFSTATLAASRTENFVQELSMLYMRSLTFRLDVKGKGKGFPYSTPSVGPGADPGV